MSMSHVLLFWPDGLAVMFLRLTTNSKIYDFATNELLDGPSMLALFGARVDFLTVSISLKVLPCS